MSIMPGIESRAPERTETSSGLPGSPNFLPVSFSIKATALRIVVQQFGGILLAVLVVVRADFGGDGEARRHRQADVGHLRPGSRPCRPAGPSCRRAVALALAEVVDELPAGHCAAPSVWQPSSTWISLSPWSILHINRG